LGEEYRSFSIHRLYNNDNFLWLWIWVRNT
jgi:hypothetical protein